MTVNRNKLPVAVNIVAGGGESGRRTGGVVTSLSEINGGSLALGTARQFRLQANLRTSSDAVLVIVGYTNPATLQNAEYVLEDLSEARDSVPSNTTLYFSLIDPFMLEPVSGGADDYMILTTYD